MQRWQCSQWQPSKLCLIKYELDMHILFVQTVYFNLGFLCVPWVPEYLAHFLILSTNGEIHRTKLLSFQGYRCKWGIALFAWKVTWNYAYSSFNGICRFSVILQTEHGKSSPSFDREPVPLYNSTCSTDVSKQWGNSDKSLQKLSLWLCILRAVKLGK